MSLILHSKPWITEADIEAVEMTLRRGMIAQGEVTAHFEESIARWAGAAGGVATGSGSAAIVLALKALEIGLGDEVILPSYVCVSVMDAVVSSGAKPVLADVGSTWVMCANDAVPCITERTRAIIVPDMYGVFADVKSFRPLGVPLIEDWAQGFADADQRRIEGEIAILSFHPTKCLTTGEGGMAISMQPALLSKLRELRDGPGAARARQFSPLPDHSAALGLSQLGRYPEMLARRRTIADLYHAALSGIVGDALPALGPQTMNFRFPLKLRGGTEAYQARFLAQGVHVRKGVDKLLHRFLGVDDSRYSQSVAHFETVVSLPIYPALTDTECARVVDVACEVLSHP